MTEKERIRVLIELDEDSPIFRGLYTDVRDIDVASESIYYDWLKPIIGMAGGKIVALETDYALRDPDYPRFLPWTEP